LKKKLRIAVATNGKKGLGDSVSEVFGRAGTFTIVDVENGKRKKVKVIENPARSYEHGAGPIAVKELVDSKVGLVIAPQLGHGASSILEHHGITIVSAKAGTEVAEAIEGALKKLDEKK
jgi:predicted Fe-Mo cluster-binding NifX family protein